MGNKVMPNEVLYHIGISAEMLKGAEYALLPGDPGLSLIHISRMTNSCIGRCESL